MEIFERGSPIKNKEKLPIIMGSLTNRWRNNDISQRKIRKRGRTIIERRSKDPAVFAVYGLGHGLPVTCMEANGIFGLARDRGFIS